MAFCFLYQPRKVPWEYLGRSRWEETPSALSSTSFMGLRPVVKLTRGAIRVDMPPIRSVWESTNSRIPGLKPLYLSLALAMMSPMRTPLGQATSQRLQLVQCLRALSKSSGLLMRSRSPSGPACLGPG
ncbi:hypothetical protein D3C72_1787750 [compost metagenome]